MILVFEPRWKTRGEFSLLLLQRASSTRWDESLPNLSSPSPPFHPHIRRGFQWILKITSQTTKPPPPSFFPLFHSPLISVTRISVLPFVSSASSQPLPVAPFRLQQWKFHSKWTPLCKYPRESLLMLSWGGQRVVCRTGWSRGGAWLMARTMSRNRRNVLAESVLNLYPAARCNIDS